MSMVWLESSFWICLDTENIAYSWNSGELTKVCRLEQNTPNPFNPATKISFTLPESKSVRLNVYSVNGRAIATLIDEPLPSGQHEVIWAGQNNRGQRVASGTYFYRLEAGTFTETKRMTLIK